MLSKLTYPIVRRSSASYYIHGKLVPEPYDYLENPSNDETKSFVDNQNQLFEAFMEPSSELMKKTNDRISTLLDYPRTGCPAFHGGMYYYNYNTGLQNQSILMRAKKLDGPAEVFLDPNEMNADGTTAINVKEWSQNEELLAYGLCDKGSDWVSIHVRSAKTGKDLSDKIEWAKFTALSWWGNEGFFYTRYPSLGDDVDKGAETNLGENPFLCFHRIGTPQEEDMVILKVPEHPLWSLGAEVSDCQRYLIVELRDGCEPKNLYWIAPLPSSTEALSEPLNFQKVINEFVAEYSYLGNDEEEFYFLSTKGAPRRKVVCLSLKNESERDVVEEQSSLLGHVILVKQTLLLIYIEDVKHVFYYRTLTENTLNLLDLPIGSIESFFAKRNKDFVSFKISSFLLPGRIFMMDINDPQGSLKIFKDDTVSGVDPDKFTVKQVFFESLDGTRIPMFIVHGDTPVTSSSPVLVYGYGGFNISLMPYFSPYAFVILQNFRGVMAIPNIRGGGEYGEEWHDAGRRANKQNSFTDFIESVKYLHAEGIGSPQTTAIMGGSNGGLLVAAVANQAPELLRCVVCCVGVLDMYKFHKFTIGHAWISDYGDPDKEEDFKIIEKYSPLHNIKPGIKYPAILVLTGDHDDRVVPLHSLKYMATLQHANPTESGPFLACIEVAAGHGAGKPISKQITEKANIYSFIAKSVGASWHD
ncbi:unnamed protein product [Phytomonas sp. Hart1]|nr:unnamed protein product [Phytomonas sp. Hart1]|eukprot:CCW70091.1 unnamed protein product [Phytomonas sp. isolate Hart1]